MLLGVCCKEHEGNAELHSTGGPQHKGMQHLLSSAAAVSFSFAGSCACSISGHSAVKPYGQAASCLMVSCTQRCWYNAVTELVVDRVYQLLVLVDLQAMSLSPCAVPSCGVTSPLDSVALRVYLDGHS